MYIEIKNFTILSLFDGMSCGQIAINKLGIQDYTYFASEINPYPIAVTKYNYPNTIHLGSVVDISLEIINDKILLNNKYLIDPNNMLLIGGSPCQGFSFAGKQLGASTKCNIEITSLEQYLKLKDEKFEFHGQSYLFWEYIRIKTTLEQINSNLPFLLENVKMKKHWENIFNLAVNNTCVAINSTLVSAQNRPRLYWTKLNDSIPQPENKNIFIKDIIEENFESKFLLSQRTINTMFRYVSSSYQSKGKSPTLTTEVSHGTGKNASPKIMMELFNLQGVYRKFTPLECERLQTVPDNYTKFGIVNGKIIDISNTQRMHMLGNGWTVDVIVHILSKIL